MKELYQKQKMMLASTTISIFLILLGIVSMDVGVLGNMIMIAVLVFVISIFLIKYAHYSWLKSLEMQFPNFIRDVSDSIRSGMSMKQAIISASKTDYGKLSEEIRRIAAKLTWDVPLARTLEIFENRVKGSRLMSEALIVMKEANISGGNVAATLDAIARNMLMLKEIDAERESMARGHTILMYGIFFVFLGIAIMIISIMVPIIEAQPPSTQYGFGFSNPCPTTKTFPCSFFTILGMALGLSSGITLYYASLFFTIVVVEGIFMGLIVGQMSESSILAGAKHSLVMLVAAFALFIFAIRIGIIPA
ncbi:MAG: type II secretion system F family protein [Candidatus Aenigmatarchaeota archaeon]